MHRELVHRSRQMDDSKSDLRLQSIKIRDARILPLQIARRFGTGSGGVRLSS